MNIIQISEQLKDVPDQYLVSEIQNPTGAYPAYLVVSELTRRKRMREGALKEEPQTTVTEDLAGIAASPQAAQSTLGAARQQMAQAPQQDMMQAPQMPAQLAGQMPQMPQMMAGGGLVAFEKGGPIRAQSGLFIGNDTFRAIGGAPLVAEESFMPRNELVNLMTLQELQEYNRTQKIPSRLANVVQGRTISGSMGETFLPGQKPVPQPPPELRTGAGTGAPPPSATQGTAQGAGPGPGPAPTGIRAAAAGIPSDIQSLLTTARGQTLPTEQQIQTTRTAAESEFEQRFPFRQKEILEKRIAERTAELQKDKDMNFNDALLAAGAAILSAPGGGTKWMGEGLKAFNQTMIEGKKDMRKAQQLIEQSELDLAQAESLRDQGKFAAADRAEDRALTRAEKGRQFAQSDAALALQAFTAQATAAKDLAMAEAYQATARTAGLAKTKPAEPLTSIEVMMEKQRIKEANPKATDAQIEQFLKQMYGDRYIAVPTIPPLVRGTGTTGATLPQ